MNYLKVFCATAAAVEMPENRWVDLERESSFDSCSAICEALDEVLS